MAESTRCVADGCDRKVLARGRCQKHYDQFYRSEKFQRIKAAPKRTTQERFWEKVSTDGPCWLWQGATMGSLGYGQFRYAGPRSSYAHRVSWELANGPIPEGALVLHRCD